MILVYTKGALLFTAIAFVLLTAIDKRGRTPFFYLARLCIILDATCWQLSLVAKWAVEVFSLQIRSRIHHVEREVVREIA